MLTTTGVITMSRRSGRVWWWVRTSIRACIYSRIYNKKVEWKLYWL